MVEIREHKKKKRRKENQKETGRGGGV